MPFASKPFHPSPEALALAAENLGLIRWTVSRMRMPVHVDRRDIEQEGYFVLLRCAEKYDGSRGTFASYAVPSLRLGLLRPIRQARCVGSLPSYVLNIFAGIAKRWHDGEVVNVDAVIAAGCAKHSYTDPDHLLRERWTSNSYMTWRLGERSLSEPVGAPHDHFSSPGATKTLADVIPDDEPTPEDTAESERRATYVRDLLARAELTERERTILDARFFADPEQTLADVGERLGITRERVRQLESRALRKLREAALSDAQNMPAGLGVAGA